ncbi:hypothetical protein GH5_04391 [Leishmania sp. Ghana 2012 LV757]|uniref:hypothetical protein n=1 Tax=Leishmania sp. Ghana 2012 LV757 TaxID=2803181 RepID=UPI001B44668F|nr:hypothetical protein GH5_04391 [Leishmania sp. Ghana 2012 LV757]
MRTGTQQRYCDILRREAEAHKTTLHCGTALVTAQLSGPGSHPVAVTMRTAVSEHGGRGHRTEPPPAFRSSASLVCDPFAELGIPLTMAPSVVEYVCGRRGFTSLHPNFLRFEHLRCIVVEHNAFEALHNLIMPPSTPRAFSPASALAATGGLPPLSPPPPLHRGCRRLTHFHAAYNCIRDIAGDTDISRLSLLEHLSLAHNQLTDLDKVLRALRGLRGLRFLDLRGNPVTGEPRYRERCVAALPQVEVLDCQSVTPKEREAAAARWNQCAHGNGSHSTVGATAAARSVRPCTSPSRTKARRAAVDLFSKSLTARDLERNYGACLRQRRRAQEAAVQSTAAARRHEEETWKSFHAIWTLSQPGMPLSADGWQRTQMAAAALEGAEDGEGPEAQRSLLLSNPSFRLTTSASVDASAPPSPLRAGGKQVIQPPVSLAAATITAAATLTHVSGGSGAAALSVKIDVPLDRPLFPSTPATADTPTSVGLQRAATAAAPATSSSLSSAATVTPLLPSLHDSVYFRTIRGGAAASRNDMEPPLLAAAPAPTVSWVLPVKGPAPDRLVMLQRALKASAQVVRVAAARRGSLGARKKPAMAPVVAAPERAGSERRNVASSLPSSPSLTTAATTSIPVELSILRTIQEAKHAVVPPPWEDTRESGVVCGAEEILAGPPRAAAAPPGTTAAAASGPHGIGVVSAATTQQEALTEILVLLHEVYCLKELQALEGEYGGAELLRLLPLREWSILGAENGAVNSASTIVAARQAMGALARPGNVGSATGGGGGSGRVSPSQHDRKRFAGAKGAANGGNVRSSSVGAAAARGGSAEAAGGAQAAAAALSAARAALPSEPQQVWQLLTGPYIAAGTTPGGSHGVLAAPGKRSSSTSSSPTSSATPAGATNSNNTSAAPSGAVAATIPAASLRDPEVVQYLVRPIGPYASHVLGPLLALLQARVAEEKVQTICDALVAHHSVHEIVNAAVATAALMSTVTTAEPQPRVASSAPRNKKEPLPVTEDCGSTEARSKKLARASASPFLSDAASSAPLPSVLSATGSPARSSAKAAQEHQQHQRLSAAPQLSLTGVLTALLFSPTFVRARVAYLEEKLSRMAAATMPLTAAGGADHAAQKGSDAAALSCLFHRVQAVKMQAARIEAALAAAGPSATANEALHFLDPKQVLVAYTGRH